MSDLRSFLSWSRRVLIFDYIYWYESRSGNTYTEAEFLELLGIPPMGITIQDIIDTFVKEEE